MPVGKWRRITAVSTLLTFWPPLPPGRVVVPTDRVGAAGLIGTEIDRLAARSYTGAGVNEAEYALGWKRIHEQYQSVVETRAPRLEINDAAWTGREFITYERFIAPLSTDGAVIDALFGALYPV